MTQTTSTTPTSTPELNLTVHQAAAKVPCAPKRVYAAIRNGELRAIRLSRRMIRIRQSDFENWLSTLETTRSPTPAQERPKLDADTIAFLSELAAAAPALSEEQKDTVRRAFRAPPEPAPKMPRPPYIPQSRGKR